MRGPSHGGSVPLLKVVEYGNNNHDKFLSLHSALVWTLGAPPIRCAQYGVRYHRNYGGGANHLEFWRLLNSVWPDWTLAFDWLSETSPWPLILEELKKRAEDET